MGRNLTCARGVAIGLLGWVGVLVALRADKVLVDRTTIQRVLWAIVTLGLLVTEVRSIQQDRDEQFKEYKRTLDSITGGDSFDYVLFSVVGDKYRLVVVTEGEMPVRDVYVEMVDADVAAQTKQFTFDAVDAFTTYFPVLPYTSKNVARTLGTFSLPTSDVKRFHFNFFAFNGVWSQRLTVRKIGDRWVAASEVTNGKDGPRPLVKVLRQYVQPGFPEANGSPDW